MTIRSRAEWRQLHLSLSGLQPALKPRKAPIGLRGGYNCPSRPIIVAQVSTEVREFKLNNTNWLKQSNKQAWLLQCSRGLHLRIMKRQGNSVNNLFYWWRACHLEGVMLCAGLLRNKRSHCAQCCLLYTLPNLNPTFSGFCACLPGSKVSIQGMPLVSVP